MGRGLVSSNRTFMRHEAAIGRNATVLEDLGIGVAVFALAAAVVTGIGLWAQYVTGVFFILATAVLAWHSGFRPALVTATLSTIAIPYLVTTLDAQATLINIQVRVVSIGVVSLVVAWLCGNLHSSRERLLIEQARLRESESFHRLIGELASDFAFHARIEPGGHIVIDSATSGLKVVLGYTVDDLQNRPGLALIHPEDRPEIQDAFSRAGAGEEVHGEARVIAKDGHVVFVEYRAHPERNTDGSLTGVLGAFRDVTLQKQQQIALASERQRLLVDIAKRQEVEAQLRQAKEEAERRADEAEEARAAVKDREHRLHYESQLKDEFLATLAHELRNPLAPLRNVAAILQLEPLSETARHATGVMERQISQLVRLIDDLMDVSRITRGQLTLRKDRVDLRSIIETAVETAQPQLTAAGVTLSMDLGSEPTLLDADATRISQIVLNLLTNAAKFTPAGGTVSITIKRHVDRVSLIVRDSGVGIAPEDQEKVFGMFVQLNRDMRRTQTGLGIGLTLVKQMTEMHGGTVSVWSAGLGQGSEFTVTLPLAAVPDTGRHQAPAAPAPHTALRILVADDSQDGADSLAFLLKAAGHEVFTAYDGRSAIAMAEEHRPDAVLLDIGMPEVSGYDVARAIRREAWGRPMRLIALTGWGQAEHRRRSLEVGFDDHLVKPVELDVLENVLQFGTPSPISGKAQPIS
ncbi:MAG TPA: ATP-binding protein [Vicinamibacterales bacterium]|nr:ATP-binding protein [Vicinamibacterales bacterium]